jgi:hypothetical protein
MVVPSGELQRGGMQAPSDYAAFSSELEKSYFLSLRLRFVLPSKKKREATNGRGRNDKLGNVISVHETASAQGVWTVAVTQVKD